LPVPRGPKRKKLCPGGLKNLGIYVSILFPILEVYIPIYLELIMKSRIKMRNPG